MSKKQQDEMVSRSYPEYVMCEYGDEVHACSECENHYYGFSNRRGGPCLRCNDGIDETTKALLRTLIEKEEKIITGEFTLIRKPV